MEDTRVRNLSELVSFRGVATSAGAADGSTIVCADLAAEPNFKGLTVIVTSGDYRGQAARITDDTTGGTITLSTPCDGQVASGVEFVVSAILAPVTDLGIVNYGLADEDDFDVADADADTERWDVGYIAGAAGGSADINTTTADRLFVEADPSAGPATARYGVWHKIPLYADYLRIECDMSCTWGSADSVTAKAVGIILSKGDGAFDSDNFIAFERQKGTSINRFQIRGTLNATPFTAVNLNTTDDAVALRIERWNQSWRFYYSASQYPSQVWVLVGQVDDASNYLTNQLRMFLQAYTPGSDVDESASADFGYFRYYVGSGGGDGQFLVGPYDSSWVTSNRDGNLFERSENIISVAGQRNDAAPAMNAAPTDTDTVVMHLKAIRETVGQEPADADDSLHTVAGQRDDAPAAMNAASTGSQSLVVLARSILERIGETPADPDDSLHTVAGQRDDAAPAMNAAPGDTDTVIKHLKAIRETVGQTSADPDDSILTNLGQRDDAATNDDMSDIATTSIVAKLRLILNRMSDDAFTATIQGSARTALDTMLAQLATYLSDSGAAMSIQVNNQTARANLEQALEDFFTVFGCDGTNVFDPAMFSGSQTTLEAAFTALGIRINTLLGYTDGIWTDALTTTFTPVTSIESALKESGGIGLLKEGIAIAGTGAQTINLFQLDGCVIIKDIIMVITAVGDATTFSNVKFTLYDGTNTVDLTDVVDGSSTVVGSKFFKGADDATALVHLKGDQIRVYESSFNRPFVEAFVNSKAGADNYLQLSFTGDGATDITATVYVRWVPTCSSGSVTAV